MTKYIPLTLVCLLASISVAEDTIEAALKAQREKDWPTALRVCGTLAEKGLARAQDLLARMHYLGQGTPVNEDIAFSWFTKAAAQGFAPAMHMLGAMYFEGRGVKRDATKAKQHLEQAANKGMPDSYWLLGEIHLEEKNEAKARAAFDKAAAFGSVPGMHRAALYLEAEGKHQDAVNYMARGALRGYEPALEWLNNWVAKDDLASIAALAAVYKKSHNKKSVLLTRKAAELGHPAAMYDVALMHFYGRGVKKDRMKAQEWFEKSAAKGYALAAGFVAQEAEESKDWAKALEFWQLANSGEAAHRIGVLHLEGLGVAKDPAKAAAHFLVALQKGHKPALADLATVVEHVSDAGALVALAEKNEKAYRAKEVKRPKATEHRNLLWKTAASAGDPAAMYVFARILQKGAEAEGWFRKAAAKNHAGAAAALGVGYRDGVFGKKDPNEALKWFIQAVEFGETQAAQAVARLYEGLGKLGDARAWATAYLNMHADAGKRMKMWHAELGKSLGAEASRADQRGAQYAAKFGTAAIRGRILQIVPDGQKSILTIDRGSRHGVRVGQTGKVAGLAQPLKVTKVYTFRCRAVIAVPVATIATKRDVTIDR